MKTHPATPAAPVVTAVAPPAPLLAGGARRVRNASLPQIQRKVALVIGVDRYADSTIPTLANAPDAAVCGHDHSVRNQPVGQDQRAVGDDE